MRLRCLAYEGATERWSIHNNLIRGVPFANVNIINHFIFKLKISVCKGIVNMKDGILYGGTDLIRYSHFPDKTYCIYCAQNSALFASNMEPRIGFEASAQCCHLSVSFCVLWPEMLMNWCTLFLPMPLTSIPS